MTPVDECEVMAVLQSLGWSRNCGTAIAFKTYTTAVGPKDALVYLTDWGNDSPNAMLTGDYWSEGRNILEPCCQLLPKDADAASVRPLIEQFAARVETAVAESYARRLELRYGENRAEPRHG